MSKKQSKKVSVERHIAANPQATLKSVARATGVSHNYVYKINKTLKETEAHVLMSKDMKGGSGPSIAKQGETIYAQRKDMNSVRAHVRKLEEQDRARAKQLNSKNVWNTITGVTSDPDLISELPPMAVSDGSTASYYELPTGCTELQHLISHKDMNAQIGEIFRSCYRYGESSHSNKLRDAKKIKFYIDAEIARLET